jgi:hypothetical protein
VLPLVSTEKAVKMTSLITLPPAVVRLPDCLTVFLPVSLNACMDAWVPGICLLVWLPDSKSVCLSAGIHPHLSIWLSDRVYLSA